MYAISKLQKLVTYTWEGLGVPNFPVTILKYFHLVNSGSAVEGFKLLAVMESVTKAWKQICNCSVMPPNKTVYIRQERHESSQKLAVGLQDCDHMKSVWVRKLQTDNCEKCFCSIKRSQPDKNLYFQNLPLHFCANQTIVSDFEVESPPM